MSQLGCRSQLSLAPEPGLSAPGPPDSLDILSSPTGTRGPWLGPLGPLSLVAQHTVRGADGEELIPSAFINRFYSTNMPPGTDWNPGGSATLQPPLRHDASPLRAQRPRDSSGFSSDSTVLDEFQQENHSEPTVVFNLISLPCFFYLSPRSALKHLPCTGVSHLCIRERLTEACEAREPVAEWRALHWAKGMGIKHPLRPGC